MYPLHFSPNKNTHRTLIIWCGGFPLNDSTIFFQVLADTVSRKPSHIAQVMQFNKDRVYSGHLRATPKPFREILKAQLSLK